MKIIAKIQPSGNTHVVVKDGTIYTTVIRMQWIKDYLYKCNHCNSDECSHVKLVKEFLNKA